MKAAQISETKDTKFCLLKGIIRKCDLTDFQTAIRKYGFNLNEYQLLDIVTDLGLHNVNWLPEASN